MKVVVFHNFPSIKEKDWPQSRVWLLHQREVLLMTILELRQELQQLKELVADYRKKEAPGG